MSRERHSADEELRLIQRARHGNAEAVASLVRAHQSGLYAFLLRMSGKPELAEDLVQESFLRVLRNLDRFDSRYRFSTWVYTIARRLFLNEAERKRPLASSPVIEQRNGDQQSPTQQATRAETMENLHTLLDAALAMLPPLQREIVLLYHQQGWPIGEIAVHLAIPEGTIKSHLFRARRRMHQCIVADRRAADRAAEVWS